jgi:hypothetical protein
MLTTTEDVTTTEPPTTTECNVWITYRLKADYDGDSRTFIWESNPTMEGNNDCITDDTMWDAGADGSMYIDLIDADMMGDEIDAITAKIKNGVDCVILRGTSKEGNACYEGDLLNNKCIRLGDTMTQMAISHIELLIKCCVETTTTSEF